MAGLWSRVTAVLAWVIVVSTVRRAPVTLFGFDQIVSTWTFYLAVTGASGQAVSLDRFLSRWRVARAAVARRRQDGRWVVPDGAPAHGLGQPGAPVDPVAPRAHLRHGGPGEAPGGGLVGRDGDLGPAHRRRVQPARPDVAGGLPVHPELLTHATMALELGYPVLIWVKVLRPLVLCAVVLLHIGIGLTPRA